MDEKEKQILEIEKRLVKAFPSDIGEDVIRVLNKIFTHQQRLLPVSLENIEPVFISNSTLEIPYRTYFYSDNFFNGQIIPNPIILNEPNQTELSIFYCIFSRECNGYIRQSSLEKIILLTDPWVPPFVLKLLSEYVLEIIKLIALNIEKFKPELYSEFIVNNPYFVTNLKNRIVSYWNCYFINQYPKFIEYPGFLAGEAIGIWTKKEVRHVRGY